MKAIFGFSALGIIIILIEAFYSGSEPPDKTRLEIFRENLSGLREKVAIGERVRDLRSRSESTESTGTNEDGDSDGDKGVETEESNKEIAKDVE